MSAQDSAFCTNCGQPLPPGAVFCTNCGQVQGQANPPPVQQYAPPPPVQQYAPPPVYNPQYGAPQYAPPPKPKSKAPLFIVIAAGVLVIIGAVIGISLLPKLTGTNSTTIPETSRTTRATTQGTVVETTAPTETPITEPLASGLVMSQGISPDDLGNFNEGVFYFNNGDFIFFPHYDAAGAAHIYLYNIAEDTIKTLYDGYGWSLVEYNNYLYFTGNPGTNIDNSYSLYRLSADASEPEFLSSGYHYGLSIYNDLLYYIRSDSADSTKVTLCRTNLDGTGEQVILDNASGFYSIYNDYLYYSDLEYNFVRANLDGRNPEILVAGQVGKFLIGQGKLIYLDTVDNLFTADLNGQNIALIRATDTSSIGSLNSSGDRIFYTVYTSTEDATLQAYAYDLHSMGFDGSNDQIIYSSYTARTYLNIANDRVFVIDQANDSATGLWMALVRSMNFDGSDVVELPR